MSIAIVGQDRKITSLFPPGPFLGRLTIAVTEAVAKSFEEQAMRNPTRDEVKRRFEICMKHAVDLRGERQWSLDRICDSFAVILRTELLGSRWEAPSIERAAWMPKAN